MILGTKARYAVMAMVELAQRDAKQAVALSELAQAQEITVAYLEQLFSKLKKHGLVRSVRGPGGGYMLAHAASDVRISDIVKAVDEALEMTRCKNTSEQGCMAKRTRCLTHDLWHGLEQQIYNYLHAISLADVVSKRVVKSSGDKVFGEKNRIIPSF
jgi:Rrf2 family transcriptional regulator, iron-sulfur cluster assembly transcription factor